MVASLVVCTEGCDRQRSFQSLHRTASDFPGKRCLRGTITPPLIFPRPYEHAGWLRHSARGKQIAHKKGVNFTTSQHVMPIDEVGAQSIGPRPSSSSKSTAIAQLPLIQEAPCLWQVSSLHRRTPSKPVRRTATQTCGKPTHEPPEATKQRHSELRVFELYCCTPTSQTGRTPWLRAHRVARISSKGTGEHTVTLRVCKAAPSSL